jgi:hypothetical protein
MFEPQRRFNSAVQRTGIYSGFQQDSSSSRVQTNQDRTRFKTCYRQSIWMFIDLAISSLFVYPPARVCLGFPHFWYVGEVAARSRRSKLFVVFFKLRPCWTEYGKEKSHEVRKVLFQHSLKEKEENHEKSQNSQCHCVEKNRSSLKRIIALLYSLFPCNVISWQC